MSDCQNEMSFLDFCDQDQSFKLKMKARRKIEALSWKLKQEQIY